MALPPSMPCFPPRRARAVWCTCATTSPVAPGARPGSVRNLSRWLARQSARRTLARSRSHRPRAAGSGVRAWGSASRRRQRSSPKLVANRWNFSLAAPRRLRWPRCWRGTAHRPWCPGSRRRRLTIRNSGCFAGSGWWIRRATRTTAPMTATRRWPRRHTWDRRACERK